MPTHMKRLLLACFVAATSLFAADLSSFNGTWIIQSLEANGSPQTGDAIDSIVMTLKDGTYEYNSNDANAKGKFTVDLSKTPATMDVTETEGGNVGRTLFAVVELTPGEPPRLFAL